MLSSQKYFAALILSIALLASSCSSAKKDLSLFQDLPANQSGVLPTLPYCSKLEPESEISIHVTSEIPEATAEFNIPFTNEANPGMKEISSVPKQRTYIIDNKGDIDFPKLGKIHVEGMTTYELKDYLTKRISQYVKDPIVTVTNIGYRIVVMGEVKAPQTITTTADRFSILDALAEAGDLTDFAKRDNILVLRRTKDNQIEYTRLNLHDSNITQSPCFWLKNNDVVLVSPNQIKEDNSKYNQNNAYKLSVISTIVGMSTAIISLVIALAIK